jgi:hypothetical protein
MNNRRSFLKLLSAGLIGSTVDVDKLLWIPGEKTIFLPTVKPFGSPILTMQQIIEMELKLMIPKMRGLFDRDMEFYYAIKHNDVKRVSGKEFQIPLEIRNKL